MKNIITLLIAFISLSGFAQDNYLQKGNEVLEAQAEKITKVYNKEVVLTAKQFQLFEMKVEEYLIRAEKIKNSMKGREMLDTMVALQAEETREMNNILTQPQMEVYKKMKPTVQPLATAEN